LQAELPIKSKVNSVNHSVHHVAASEAISCFQAIFDDFSREIASVEVRRLATTSNS
jgi:hypothetical protein